MDSSKIPAALFFAVVVAIMTAAPRAADAQTPQEPSCAAQLVRCAAYINGTGMPPESCCGPMKVAVETEMACLCTLYTTPGLLASFGFNVAQAIAIPARCGITTACTCDRDGSMYRRMSAMVPASFWGFFFSNFSIKIGCCFLVRNA
ncbi:non-specific lipid transfer protein GPI-anchored 7-like [Rhododendron vialii]|uniref:non-specific lipid transfer protein GPI-anchored 7-like n=1 Tax=Rhododendron vialii TaxID=182163 RepID=UPI00265FAF5A|nr:non-specific lipid transfer protein GPI-anchored 7-like [Rhododendron vialii]